MDKNAIIALTIKTAAALTGAYLAVRTVEAVAGKLVKISAN